MPIMTSGLMRSMIDRGVTAGSAAETETEICNIIVWLAALLPSLLPFCFVQNKEVVRQTIILPFLHVVSV